MVSMDIVIPSIRPKDLDLDSICKMKIPPGFSVSHIVVVDDPLFHAKHLSTNGCENIKIIKNKTNLGASESRNVGLKAGKGDFVLFLDDDVIPDRDLLLNYAAAIKIDNTVPGYVGLTRFPQPVNRFTRGVLESDILTFFGIAESRPFTKWGTTSNIMIQRKLLHGLYFDSSFPKSGGGEDIDLCLRIVAYCNKNFMTVPRATVQHDWWNHGKRNYKRFYRWAYGDCVLPWRFPKYKYHNFPNFVETIFLGSIIYAILLVRGLILPSALLLFMVSSFSFELILEVFRVKHIRDGTRVYDAIEGALVRVTNEFGRMIGLIHRGKLFSIGERFDYFTTGESIRFERIVAGIKFMFFLFAFISSLLLF